MFIERFELHPMSRMVAARPRSISKEVQFDWTAHHWKALSSYSVAIQVALSADGPLGYALAESIEVTYRAVSGCPSRERQLLHPADQLTALRTRSLVMS